MKATKPAPRIYIFAADKDGKVQKILGQISSGGRILG